MSTDRDESAEVTPMYTITLTNDSPHGTRVSVAIWDDFLDLTPAAARAFAGRVLRVAEDAESGRELTDGTR